MTAGPGNPALPAAYPYQFLLLKSIFRETIWVEAIVLSYHSASGILASPVAACSYCLCRRESWPSMTVHKIRDQLDLLAQDSGGAAPAFHAAG